MSQLPSWLEINLRDWFSPFEDGSGLAETFRRQLSEHKPRPAWLSATEPPSWLSNLLLRLRNVPEGRWLVPFWIKEGLLAQPDPEWLPRLHSKFNARIAHVFLLSFNVTDVVFDPRFGHLPLTEYLWRCYEQANQVIFYNRSQGITTAEQRYTELSDNIGGKMKEILGILGIPERDYLAALNQHGRFLPDAPTALAALERLMRRHHQAPTTPPNNVLIFDFAEKVTPPTDLTQQNPPELIQIETFQRWATERRLEAARHLIILIAQSAAEVSPYLLRATSRIEDVTIPMPDDQARLKYISFLYAELLTDPSAPYRVRFEGERPDMPLEAFRHLARLTAGLNRNMIRDLVLRAREEAVPVSSNLVQERKKVVLQTESSGLLEVMEPKRTWDDLGGLAGVKEYLKSVVELLKRSAPTTPSGLLFLGPPGTGKTLAAEVMAAQSGVNFVKLGNIREMWVGQSERNMKRALDLIRAMQPVVVFVDELDQAEGKRGESGDGGVDRRLFGQLLQFMSDSTLRGRVLWIGASNRPDLIDDAMRRPGRFDSQIPFLVPEPHDLVPIFETILCRNFKFPRERLPQLRLHEIVEHCEGYTGAEVELVVTRAVSAARGAENLTHNILRETIANFIRSRNAAQYELMTLLAIREVNDRRFLPPSMQHYADDRAALEARIAQLQAQTHGLPSGMVNYA
ncbi:MAG: ATP-binding protein [Anaerolineae bacterium]|nr:ATP-binding protein [Anaerolineae bacterium]